MLAKGTTLRPLSPSEEEVLMGLPGSTSDLNPANGQTQRHVRLHAIANTFHLPSVVMFLMVLLQSVPTVTSTRCGPAPHLVDLSAHELLRFPIEGLWSHASMGAGQLCAEEIFDAACGLVPGLAGSCHAMKARAKAKLRSLDLSPLAHFDMYLESIGAPASTTGPDIQALMSKSPKM